MESVLLAAPSLSPSFQNRVLVSVWLWVMIVLTTGFSGNMKANMMFKEPPQRLDTLEDLVAAEGVRVLVPEGSVMQATAMSLRSEAGKKFWKKILDSDGVQDVKEVFTDDNMDQVLQLRAIMIFDPFAMIAKLVRRCANLQSGNQFYFSKYELLSLHLMVSYNPRLDRDFVAIMDRRLSLVRDMGLMTKWSTRLYHQWHVCNERLAPISVEQGLVLGDLQGIFLMWGIFLSLATVAFLTELFVFYVLPLYSSTDNKNFDLVKPYDTPL